jgi:FtsH-binding integral membrane protein
MEIGRADSGAGEMKSIDTTYVALGATWLVIGMVLGIVMGASENFLFTPVHAHINLIGFACHAIFGMAYRQWPAMKASSLAPYQFWIFVIATPVTLIGLVFTLTGGPVVPTIIGSLGLVTGAALFCGMIWRARFAMAD